MLASRVSPINHSHSSLIAPTESVRLDSRVSTSTVWFKAATTNVMRFVALSRIPKRDLRLALSNPCVFFRCSCSLARSLARSQGSLKRLKVTQVQVAKECGAGTSVALCNRIRGTEVTAKAVRTAGEAAVRWLQIREEAEADDSGWL